MTRPRCALRDPHSEDLLRRDGYVVLPLLTEGDLAALRAVYDRVAQAHDDGFMASVLHDDLAMRAGVRVSSSAYSVFCRRREAVLASSPSE